MFARQQVVQDVPVKQIELGLVAEETGLVHGKVFQQFGQFVFAFFADQQAVVGVEGVHAALFKAAVQAVLEEVGAARIEIHATFLVDQGLQQLEF